MFGLSAFSENSFSAFFESPIKLGVADINAIASLSADGYRIKHFAGSITANGDATAIGYRVQQGVAGITSNATVDVDYLRIIGNNNASINAYALVCRWIFRCYCKWKYIF